MISLSNFNVIPPLSDERAPLIRVEDFGEYIPLTEDIPYEIV